MIKTARIGERVNGEIIDITVKNNKNHVFAPTWDMVMGFKNGRISWDEYEKMYMELMRDRFKTRKAEFLEIVEKAKKGDVYLVCFCRDERFCHRRLAKEIIERLVGKGY